MPCKDPCTCWTSQAADQLLLQQPDTIMQQPINSPMTGRHILTAGKSNQASVLLHSGLHVVPARYQCNARCRLSLLQTACTNTTHACCIHPQQRLVCTASSNCRTPHLYFWAFHHRITLVRNHPLGTQCTVTNECDVVLETEVYNMSIGHEGVTVALQHCRADPCHLKQLQQVIYTKVTDPCKSERQP